MTINRDEENRLRITKGSKDAYREHVLLQECMAGRNENPTYVRWTISLAHTYFCGLLLIGHFKRQ